ncbi:hypothetical protein [Rhizobium sp. B21/90]|uniref:hypothetical protein n=1 Tax=Rhizobium sp. B21/90 TaxID=2819993 RepID=UPI001C5AA55B|nr:hypothetical protein [Rhizobium sp. B21/90]QYA03896.1 hypothetical protein J5278_24260 [Rhizobium sp. B21/90]
MNQTLRRIFAGTTLALGFVGSYSIVSMAFDRQPPILYEEAKALSSSVPQGGSLDVEFKVFRTRICPVVAKRRLIDSQGSKHSIPSYTVGMQMLAGRETYMRSIVIPNNASIGPALYEVDLDFICNAIHQMGFPIRVVSPR